jgi:hypothetical protein
MERAIITQHTITNIRIFSVVLRNILLFRFRFISRLARESAWFLVTFLSLLFLIIFVNWAEQKPLNPPGGCCAALTWQTADLKIIIPHIPYKGKCFFIGEITARKIPPPSGQRYFSLFSISPAEESSSGPRWLY